MSTTHWKHEISDLHERARAVSAPRATSDVRMSARATARCLSGVVRLVSRQFSVDDMQRACAALVRHDAAWTSKLGSLPVDGGAVHPAVETIAVVARGILAMSGADAMRAALSFWASESDPREWQRVELGAAA